MITGKVEHKPFNGALPPKSANIEDNFMSDSYSPLLSVNRP